MTVKNVGVNLEAVVQRQATLIGQLQSQAIMQSVALDEAHAQIATLEAQVPKDVEPGDEGDGAKKQPAKRTPRRPSGE